MAAQLTRGSSAAEPRVLPFRRRLFGRRTLIAIVLATLTLLAGVALMNATRDDAERNDLRSVDDARTVEEAAATAGVDVDDRVRPRERSANEDPGSRPGSQLGGAPTTGSSERSPTAGSHASTSPTGTRIAFVSTRDGNEEIYVMAPDGTRQKRLTVSVAADQSPTWSPDGRRIAFASDRSGNSEINTMRADGSDVRRAGGVAGEQAHWPAWSPDGRRIVFVSFERRAYSGRHRVVVMDVDGSGQRFLTFDNNEFSPAWSPDGKQIVYQSSRAIFVIDADGSNQRRLGSGTSPAWSPDGAHIAYIDATDDYARGQKLRVMEADGTNARTVYETKDEWLGHPSWSPTGDLIAFDRDPDGPQLGGTCPDPPNSLDCTSRYGPERSALWVVGTDGRRLHRLSAAGDLEPTFGVADPSR